MIIERMLSGTEFEKDQSIENELMPFAILGCDLNV